MQFLGVENFQAVQSNWWDSDLIGQLIQVIFRWTNFWELAQVIPFESVNN